MSNLYPLIKSKEYQQKDSKNANKKQFIASLNLNYYNLQGNKTKFEFVQNDTEIDCRKYESNSSKKISLK